MHQKGDPGVCVCVSFVYISLFRWVFVCVPVCAYTPASVFVCHFGGVCFVKLFVTIWFSFPEGWFPLSPPHHPLSVSAQSPEESVGCRCLLLYSKNRGVRMQIGKHISLKKLACGWHKGKLHTNSLFKCCVITPYISNLFHSSYYIVSVFILDLGNSRWRNNLT